MYAADGKTTENVRVEEIRKATVNGQKVKLFKAYRYSAIAEGFVFDGQYSVPDRTANKAIAALYIAGDCLRSAHA